MIDALRQSLHKAHDDLEKQQVRLDETRLKDTGGAGGEEGDESVDGRAATQTTSY